MHIRLLAVLCVFAATPAVAQDRGWVRALGGATFGAETAPVFGGGAGFKVTENVSLTVELGRMQDVADDDVQAGAEAAELVGRLLGLDVDFAVRLPALYGLLGARFDVPGDRVRPYLEGGVGFASISPELDASIEGFEIPGFVDDEVGLQDETDVMVGVGGGVALGVSGNVGLDLGYRYSRIFADQAIDVNAVYGALRFSF